MSIPYNTGNALGSTDPRDLLDNARNLDLGMNSPLPVFVDRLGVSRDTWQGQQDLFNSAQTGRQTQFDSAQAERESQFQDFLLASGFVSLGNYAAGLEFTAYNQYMAFGGFFYRPAPSTLPFTTSGTWVGADEDLFVLFSQDDVLRQDLAEATGAELVGHGSGTVADALKASESIFTPEQFSGLNPIQQAADAAAGGTLMLPGDYTLTAGVTISANTRVVITGTVDMSGCPTSAAAFSVSGSEGSAYPLTANAIVGAFTAGLSAPNLAASGIVAGDWVRVCSDGIFDPARTSSKIGEIIRVESVDGATGIVTFEAPLADGYLTADSATINKINFVEGVRFEGGGTIRSNNDIANLHKCIQLNLALSPYIGPMTYLNFSDRAIWLQDSIFTRIDQPYFGDSLSSGTGYGISVINACQDCVITGLVSHKVRHAFSTNNSTTTKGIPRRIVVNGFAVYVSAETSGGAGGDAMDTHAAAEEIHFSNGTIRGATGIGLNIECPTASVTNVSVYQSASHGLNHQNYSGRSGELRVNNFKSVLSGADGIRVTPTGSALDLVKINNVSVYDAAQAAVNINGNTSNATRNIEIDSVTSYRHGSSIAAVLVTNADRGQVNGITAIDGTNVAGFAVRVRDSKNVNVDGVGGRLPSSSTGGMVQFNGSGAGLCSNNLVDGVQGGSPSAVSSRGILVDNNCQSITIGQKNDLSAFSTRISWGTGTGNKGGFLTGSATYDPPSVAAGAETTTTVTVTGAALGDLAAASFSISLGGLRMSAEVTAANTVTVTLRNNTGSPIDIASGTLRAMVEKI